MNGDVHGGHARRGSATGASRFLTGLVTCFATHGGIPAVAPRRLAPVGAGRHADQLGEAGAERAQRRAADREADLGDAEVAAPQQRHRALDAPRHQVAVRRLAVGEPELAAEVPGRHVRAAGERLDVQRLRVLPVDPVADAAQPREVAQALRRRRVCWSPRRSCHVATIGDQRRARTDDHADLDGYVRHAAHSPWSTISCSATRRRRGRRGGRRRARGRRRRRAARRRSDRRPCGDGGGRRGARAHSASMPWPTSTRVTSASPTSSSSTR